MGSPFSKTSKATSFVVSTNTEGTVSQLRGKLLPGGAYPKDAWDRLVTALDHDLSEIRSKKSSIVPEVRYREIESNGGRFTEGDADLIRKRGCVVVRGMLPEEEAEEMRSELMEYLSANNVNVKEVDASPIKDVYWSKAQMKMRQHPHMLATQKALLALWSTDDDAAKGGEVVDLSRPLCYIDRLRVRVPGNETNLRGHIDSGSINRWTDELYRKCYENIFTGNWEAHDPFRVSHRGHGAMGGKMTFFRAFQGWTALTPSGPGDGTLTLLPNVKEAIAYVLLRPLGPDVNSDLGVLNAIDNLAYVTPESLFSELHNAMVSVPRVEPGDSVWWHPDVIHSVEPVHKGGGNNVVVYIPAGPDCPLNRAYLRQMRPRFESGTRPPDFEWYGLTESEEQSFVGRASALDLSDEGKRTMGL